MTIRTLAALLLITASAARAGDSGWRLNVGVAYRTFDDVRFQLSHRNYDRVDNGPFGIQNYLDLGAQGPLPGSGVTADYVRVTGGDVTEDSDAFSPMIGFDRFVSVTETIQLGITVNFQYFSFEASMDSDDIEAEHYNYFIINGVVQGPPRGGPFPGLAPGVQVQAADGDIDFDIYALDMGLRSTYRLSRPLELTAAIGPSIYFADAHTRQVESAVWNAIPGTNDPGFYNLDQRDSQWDVAVGMFTTAGITCHINEFFSLGLEYRFDYVRDRVGTDLAKVGLQSHGAQIKASIAF